MERKSNFGLAASCALREELERNAKREQNVDANRAKKAAVREKLSVFKL